MQNAATTIALPDSDDASGPPAANFGHVPALDGIRGIAIIVVMVYHLEYLMPELHPFVKGGFLGVDVFFVLSGFLITSILLSEYETTSAISLKNFYIRRGLRLIPAFWLFLICLYFFGNFFLQEFEASLVYGRYDFVYAITYTMNWFSASNHGFDSNLNHAWSLSIEEQFYIIWSLILYKAFSEKRPHKQILFLTIGFVIALCVSRAIRAFLGADTRTLYYSTDTRIDSLLVGCAASMMFIWKVLPEDALRSIWFKILSVCSVLAALTVFISLSHEDLALYVIGSPVFNLSVAAMIFWVVSRRDSFIHKILENSGVRWIGNISYGLYLWHYLMYELAKKEFGTPGSEIFVGLTLAFLMATVSYYLVEKPFLRLKSRFNFKAANA